MPLNICIQWNAGTACMSECVRKTLACLRVWLLNLYPCHYRFNLRDCRFIVASPPSLYRVLLCWHLQLNMHPPIRRTRRGCTLRKCVFQPSKRLLKSAILEPLLLRRTLLRTLPPSKAHSRHLLRTLLETFSKAVSRTFLGTLPRVTCCVVRAPPLQNQIARKNLSTKIRNEKTAQTLRA